MLLLTLVVTFLLVVGLAVAVLLSVAAPSLRRRGSRAMARLDDLAEQRVLPLAHRGREAAAEAGRRAQEHLAARRAATDESAHQH